MDNLVSTYIYEIKKGSKLLALVTLLEQDVDCAIEKIKKAGFSHCAQKIEGKVNLFFGEKCCIDIISTFKDKDLCNLTPQEDFILGIMLGYSREKQCHRYLNRLDLCPIG